MSLVFVKTGLGLTVINKLSSRFFEHPVTPTETTYSVVEEGFAIGLGILLLLNPADGLQTYSSPPVAFNCTPAVPLQNACEGPATGFASCLTFTNTDALDVQLLPHLPVTV